MVIKWGGIVNIIEKLGIKPIQVCYGENYTYFDGDDVKELEQQRNELLEALIKWQKSFASTIGYQKYEPNVFTLLNERFCESSDIIEKVDSQHRSWEEIKELL